MKKVNYGSIPLRVSKRKPFELILIVIIVLLGCLNLTLSFYYEYTNIYLIGIMISLAFFNLFNNMLRVDNDKLGVNEILFTDKVIKYFIQGGVFSRSIYTIDIDYIHIKDAKCTIYMKVGKPKEFTLDIPLKEHASSIVKYCMPSVKIVEG